MVPVLGRPFLDLKLASLQILGFTSVTILVAELSELIEAHISNHEYEMDIRVVCDGESLLGTAGSIAKATSLLPDLFWVTYGDSYVTADLDEVERASASRGIDRVMIVMHNFDRWQKSNVTVLDGLVGGYEPTSLKGIHEWIDYGLLRFSRSDFIEVSSNSPTDLSQVIKHLVERRQMMAVEVTDRFWEIGTPKSLRETESHFRSSPPTYVT